MQTSVKKEIYPQLGVHQNLPQPAEKATEIVNMQYDDLTSSWHNRIGFEKYFTNRSIQGVFNSPGSVDSIYNWSTHNGARTWLYFEYNGALYYVNGSNGFSGDPKQLVTTRTKAIRQTHYNPFGDYLVLCNGKDNPIFIKNGSRVYNLGLPSPTSPEPTNAKRIRNETSSVDTTKNWANSLSDFFASNTLRYSVPSAVRNLQDDTFQGLGAEDAGLDSEPRARYQWKVSFVFEDGSESALSEPSRACSWSLASLTIGTNAGSIRPCIGLSSLPIGPPGTVARRIYRTTSRGQLFYFEDIVPNNVQEHYVSFRSDDELGSLAPDSSTNSIFPVTTARFSATFQNRLFIDGGPGQDRVIYYSEPGTINQFGARNYFDVGTLGGGSITAMISYYNQLLVFKDKGIDVIVSDSAGNLQIRPFVQGVGCNSPHAITIVPNVGVFFFNASGVYVITGGYDADTISMSKLTEGLQGLFEQVSENQLRKVVSGYSNKYREVHFYFSVDGSADLDVGLVYHIDNGQFSVRQGFPVKCITANNDGLLVFGSNFEGPAAEGDPINRGLFVISNKRNSGYVISDDQEAAAGPLTTRFRSSWHDFGYEPRKKFIKYLYLYIMTQGDDKVALQYYRDRSWEDPIIAGDGVTEGEKQQRGDHPDQPVWGSAVWNTAKWQDSLLTPLRYDVSLKGASDFAFEFETSNRIEFNGYAVEITVADTKMIKGKV